MALVEISPGVFVHQDAPNAPSILADKSIGREQLDPEVANLVIPSVNNLMSQTNINWSSGRVFYNEISSNKTYTFSNSEEGGIILLFVKNIGTSPVTINLPPTTTAIDTTVQPGKTNLYTFVRVNGQFIAQVSVESPPPPPLQVRRIYLNTPNGYGTANTAVRRYSNVLENSASGYITLNQSSSLGDSFVILKNGIYSVTGVDGVSSGFTNIALTRNASGAELTAGISPNSTNLLCTATGSSFTPFSWSGVLLTGDIIRAVYCPMSGSAPNTTAAQAHLCINFIQEL